MTEKQKKKDAFWQSLRNDTSVSRNLKTFIYILVMGYIMFDGCVMPSFLRGYGETTFATVVSLGGKKRKYKFLDKDYHWVIGHEGRGFHPNAQPGDTIAVKYLKAFPKINKSVDETKRCVLSAKCEE